VLWAIIGVGLLVIVVVLLVITVFDSNAVPWLLRFAPLPGLAMVVPAAALEAPVPLFIGLALVLVGLSSQVLWDQMLGGARQDGRGRHSIRRRLG
jgi:hypothetical protein